MTPDPAIFGPASLCVTQGIQAFVTFLPRFTDIRRANPTDNPDVVDDVRMGEIAAVTLSLGVGIVASSLTGSPIPAIASVVTCLVLVVLYEASLAQEGTAT